MSGGQPVVRKIAFSGTQHELDELRRILAEHGVSTVTLEDLDALPGTEEDE